jgi:hypothetical protein
MCSVANGPCCATVAYHDTAIYRELVSALYRANSNRELYAETIQRLERERKKGCCAVIVMMTQLLVGAANN